MGYDWNFSRLVPYADAFFYGTVTTVALTVIVIVLGTAIGIIWAVLLRSPVRVLLYPVVDVVRALPPLVLILMMYYLLTQQVIGVAVHAFAVCMIAMSLNLAAFTSDLVRAALENVSEDAINSGRALGMSRQQVMLHIVTPHVVREVIPGMTALYIGMLKVSSLGSVINVRELTYTAQTVISDIARSLEAWVVVGCIYVILVIPATSIQRRIERALKNG